MKRVDDTGPEHSRDVQRFSAGCSDDDAQNDAPAVSSATMAGVSAIISPPPDAMLARLLTAWDRLSNDARLRLAEDAERMAKVT